mgnify:CR=1 FL=1
MNQNNNFDDIPRDFLETMSRRISNFGAILIAAAIIGVCFAIAKIDHEVTKIAVIVFSCIVGVVGVFLMIVAAVGASESGPRHNFFLYNKKKKQDMAINELTVSLVREKLTMFMASFKHRGKLYIGDLFDERQRIPEPFKTLFCYELLCELSDENGADPELFLSFGQECGEIFYKYLSQNGDYDLGLKIKTYILDFSNGEKNVDEFKSFIVAKKRYLEEKMLEYTVKNIKKFG